MKYFIVFMYVSCIYYSIGATHFEHLPYEIVENIVEASIWQEKDLSILKSLSNITSSSKLFYIICYNHKGKIQKKVSTIFRSMWQAQQYEELFIILENYSPDNTIYKNLCQEISNYSISKEFIDKSIALLYQREQENIYVTLKKQFNKLTINKIILIAAAHLYKNPKHNILNDQASDEYFEKFVYQLTSLYPLYTESLFNKMICALVYYIKLRNKNQPQTIEIWMNLFAQTLVY